MHKSACDMLTVFHPRRLVQSAGKTRPAASGFLPRISVKNKIARKNKDTVIHSFYQMLHNICNMLMILILNYNTCLTP